MRIVLTFLAHSFVFFGATIVSAALVLTAIPG